MTHRTGPIAAAAMCALLTLNLGFSQSRAAKLEKVVRADVEPSALSPAPFKESEGAKRGDAVAPDFTLTDLEGNRVDLKSFRGRVVLLNFWATWCPFCAEEMPYLESLRLRYGKKGLVVLGITDEDADAARAFLKSHGYTFTTLVDEGGKVGESYGIERIPTTVVIGRDGRIVSREVGEQSEEELLYIVRKAGIGERRGEGKTMAYNSHRP
ncbi:MAG: TlpA family protein disulfide reductase [Acidobacteriota bacterium]|nr:TlpA family protein disulfide reductase [Acidobacteriota bacterium]